MPFYILPSGETGYNYNGVEYTGYGGPDDVVGVSGEYAAGSQFNSGPGGVDTSPRAVATRPTANSYVSLRSPGAATTVAVPVDASMVNEPTSGSTRTVMGAEQSAENPWDPEAVRRNQYDVGY